MNDADAGNGGFGVIAGGGLRTALNCIRGAIFSAAGGCVGRCCLERRETQVGCIIEG